MLPDGFNPTFLTLLVLNINHMLLEFYTVMIATSQNPPLRMRLKGSSKDQYFPYYIYKFSQYVHITVLPPFWKQSTSCMYHTGYVSQLILSTQCKNALTVGGYPYLENSLWKINMFSSFPMNDFITNSCYYILNITRIYYAFELITIQLQC